jgi:small basic protein
LTTLFDWLLFELPEIHNTVTTIEWIFVGAINILMILAVMSVFLIFRVIAIPVMIVTCLPSIIGSIGELMNKKWGMKVLLVSGIFSLVLIPFGTALGVWTIVRYEEEISNWPESLWKKVSLFDFKLSSYEGWRV